MNRKSRRTEIIAHCGMKKLVKAFPEVDKNEFCDIYKNGEVVDTVTKGYTNADLVIKYAIEAGYSVKERVEEKIDQNYINICGTFRRLSYKGERKTGINFESSYDEAEHYEKVDEIVRELALKDIAVLRGECEITITTRC